MVLLAVMLLSPKAAESTIDVWVFKNPIIIPPREILGGNLGKHLLQFNWTTTLFKNDQNKFLQLEQQTSIKNQQRNILHYIKHKVIGYSKISSINHDLELKVVTVCSRIVDGKICIWKF